MRTLLLGALAATAALFQTPAGRPPVQSILDESQGLETAAEKMSSAGSIAPAAQPQQSAAEVARTVAIKFADGRVMRCSSEAQPRGSGWTPIVPKIPGVPTSRDGLELSALDHACGRQAGELTVTISLWYGSPHQRLIPVATVVPRDGVTVRVEELRAFGVQPVEISIETRPAPSLQVPGVGSASSGVHVSAQIEGPPSPGYVFSLQNAKTQAVMEVKFDTYRGNAVATRGGAHHLDGTPLMQPGETYIVRQPAGIDSRTGQWRQMDRFQITSVTWADGSEEHSPSPGIEGRVPLGITRPPDASSPLAPVRPLAGAESPSVRTSSGGNNTMVSPTVFATWITRSAGNDSHLQLLVLWRGTPGWYFVPGGRIGGASNAAGSHWSIEYGDVNLTLDYGAGDTVAINGREVHLGTDNVVYVDEVDAPTGARVVRTARIPSQMPGAPAQIGLTIRNVPDLVTYLRCDARASDPQRQMMIERMGACAVTLGR
jgi:hypothetical protein